MTFMRTLISSSALLLLVALIALAQTPAAENKHFAKDGLSFDYPANWQISDQSTPQMQFIQLVRGDLEVRVRVPREWLKIPEKETQAKKLFQDQYVQSLCHAVGAGRAASEEHRGYDSDSRWPGRRHAKSAPCSMAIREAWTRTIQWFSDRLVHLSIIG